MKVVWEYIKVLSKFGLLGLGILAIIYLISLGLPNDDNYLEALDKAGYSNASLVEGFTTCAYGEWGKNFTAVVNEKQIEGSICKGSGFKGYTVRF
ncbi:hypothetical protein H6G33_09805 [Calothrix sp. FACHB-1219]|uniref:hypothetical protein n=1 Tax=unclassified Calothrix TaxID=2619626 RepID=UPI0016876EAD|nr:MULTISPECIES: hypothetical protein [unclassified Calothrix]MBD2201640.1 hypothetical protein [Calothrix sp. FACHB-168]MBD2217326.1 hypothetical protein [Calothrix sp. FACHB-1219]